MRGFLLCTGFLFITHCSFGQLTVKPSNNGEQDHYIYVKESLLFIEDNLQLTKNTSTGTEPSIYLRKGAQIIQGEEQATGNRGTGSISIFSEGSANAYDYNYWGTPVSSPDTGLFGINLLNSPVTPIKSLSAQLTTGLNGLANPLTISTRWIYTFTGNGYSNWNFVGGSTAIPPGYGFIMKGTEGIDLTNVENRLNNPGNAQRYDFRGKANSGRIEIPIKTDDYVLLGNPFPSALDLSLFLLENSGEGTLKTACYEEFERKNVTTGIAYFWDSKKDGASHYLQDYVGGYGAFSPVDPCTTGVYQPPLLRKVLSGEEDGSKGKTLRPRFLEVAHGFMIQGAGDGKIVFRNGQRKFQPEDKTGAHKQMEISHKKHIAGNDPVVLPRVELIVSLGDGYERKLGLAFWKEATTGVDAGMDAEAFELADTDAGWLQDEKSFVIDVRKENPLDEIPLFLRVSSANPAISFSQGASINTGIKNLYILDSSTNEFFSISEEALTLELEPGTYHGRFKLTFTAKVPEEELPEELYENEQVPANFDIVQNNHLGELEIIGNDYFPVKAVGIFDLQGKRMLYRTNFDNRRSVSFTTAHWANAVYLVKVTGMDNRKTIKKIAVFNK